MRRVLVCEDDDGLRGMIAAVVESGGYKPIVAVDGQDGWEKLEAAGADMVVLDLNMPRLDGLGLIARIRKDKRFREMPIMLLTIRDMVAEQVAGYERGVDDYVIKPFDNNLLIARLRALERRLLGS